jgi:hypothetical protein
LGVDGAVEVPPDIPAREQTAADKAVKVVVSDSGKPVRVVGQYDSAAVVMDGDLGKAVVIATPPENAYCNVVFAATEKDGKPVVTGLGNTDYLDGPPHMVQPASGKCKAVWNVLLRGDACKKAAGAPELLGSTLRELENIKDPELKKCVLRQEGTCEVTVKDGQKFNATCLVPLGDSRAKPGAPAVFPHAWSRRDDLNVGADETKEGLAVH